MMNTAVKHLTVLLIKVDAVRDLSAVELIIILIGLIMLRFASRCPYCH